MTATAPDPTAGHVHDEQTCPAHASGCSCPDRASGSCNPGWDAECPTNLDSWPPPAPVVALAARSALPAPTAAPSGAARLAAVPDQPDGDPVKDKPLTHDWLVAAIIHVDDKTAKHADFRQSFRTKENQRIDALDVYCKGCRRPYDEVADQPCAAKQNNEHLIGGDPGVRKKRKIFVHHGESEAVRAPTIQRQGIAALMGIGND